MESILFTVVVLILSVIIHEVAHGWAANYLGDPTARLQGRLSLNPINHIDPVGSILIPGILVLTNSPFMFGWAKPVPYNPYNLKNQRWGEAIVGGAGVATNLLIALIFAVITRFAFAQGLTDFGTLTSIVVFINLSLGLFNLLPIPPLDGFTVLRGMLQGRARIAFQQFEQKVEAGGALSLILVLFLFSYFLAKPFSLVIHAAFSLLVGI